MNSRHRSHSLAGHLGVRGAVLAIALSMLGGHAAEVSAASPTTTRVWQVQRTSSKITKGFTLQATFSWPAGGGFVASASLRRNGTRLLPLYGSAIDIRGDDGPVVIRDGVGYGCTVTISCPSINEGGISAYATGTEDGPDQPDLVYVVIRGSNQIVNLSDSPGWKLSLTRLRARTVEAQPIGTTSATAADTRIEHFATADTAGGSRGSVAIGTPPCRPAHRIGYAREGTGRAILSGGATASTTDCSTAGSTDAVGWAPAATRWKFSGDVTGVAYGPTRITVIDF